MNRKLLWGAVAALYLGACTVGPNYAPPADRVSDQATWKDPIQADSTLFAQSEPDPAWWSSFQDPVLDRLMQLAVAGNLDVQQAMLRVVEAREGVRLARSAGLPTLGASASYQREQFGLKGILESRGVFSQLDSLASRTGPGGAQDVANGVHGALNDVTDPLNLYQYGLDASWELDLFGRVRRSVEQARAQTEAQQEAANDSLVILESEVAQAYISLRSAQALQASQIENVKATEDSLDLTSRRRAQGLVTELDVNQARTQRDDAQRRLPSYEKQAQVAANALSVLTGQPPGALDDLLADAKPMPQLPDMMKLGVASRLARRRPDIRQAEAQLHAATAGIGVAVADFYPDVSLTGNVGYRATDASYLTRWSSLFYSVGPSLSLPIFEGGRLKSNLQVAKVRQKEAALAYRGAVLKALREVEDGLASYRADRLERERVADSAHSAQATYLLAREQYSHGLASFIQVTDAQRAFITSRQDLVQADAQLVNDVISLYRALGGGWQVDTAHPMAARDSNDIDPAGQQRRAGVAQTEA